MLIFFFLYSIEVGALEHSPDLNDQGIHIGFFYREGTSTVTGSDSQATCAMRRFLLLYTIIITCGRNGFR